MKVLNICTNDWANYSFVMAKALQSNGVEALSIKTTPHTFWYAEQSQLVKYREMAEFISAYDVINYVHSEIPLFNETKHLLKGKKVISTYTGSLYRANPVAHNDVFNETINMSFTDQCEFFGLGAKNLHYTPVAIDVAKYPKFIKSLEKPYILGHYPSNKEVKGSDKILDMLENIDEDFLFRYSENIVKHSEQIARMSKCDIYIELFKNELKGKPYGCYGVTAFEAAAMGKIVVTQNIRKDVYIGTFGHCPFVICNSEEDFNQSIVGLLNSPKELISEMQTDTFNWLEYKHGLLATGRYLKKLIEQCPT